MSSKYTLSPDELIILHQFQGSRLASLNKIDFTCSDFHVESFIHYIK